MKGLTDKQAARLRYITSYIEEYGRSPSYNDIAEHFGISATAAHNTVRSLVKKGLLEKKEHNLRSLSLPRKERDRKENITIPLFASEPTVSVLESHGEADDVHYIPRSMEMLDCFAFTVHSESMAGAGINPGDIAVMTRRTETLRDGDIVLALGSGSSEDKLELRTYRGVPNGAILSPDNVAMGERRVIKVVVFGILARIERNYR